MNEELNKEQPDENWGDPQFAASVIFPGFDYGALHVAIENLKDSHANGDDEAVDYWKSVFANVADLVAGTESVDAKTVKYAGLVKLYAQGRCGPSLCFFRMRPALTSTSARPTAN